MPGQQSEPVPEMDQCGQCLTGAQIVPTRDGRSVKAKRGQISRQVLRTLKKTGHSKKKKKRPAIPSFIWDDTSKTQGSLQSGTRDTALSLQDTRIYLSPEKGIHDSRPPEEFCRENTRPLSEACPGARGPRRGQRHRANIFRGLPLCILPPLVSRSPPLAP